ncbi:GT2 family glycosyltransferase [Flavobacterium sp. CG_9.1]|uniref:glycosyltransferase family 2 protein n=1 Tax=Flavobacterium sp. CG_9.1 TaxID=2787728 RepID=UPI0018C94876|nr:glycosyltransferase [Flavobacterium sp. CG_9.1]MBG6062965.1 GT2 family glycosyltransferase [Flavobacterium sp. CG_9.1]
MQISILIVSKNRKEELERTLLVLEKLIDFSSHEVLIFLDGCTDDSEELSNQFSWVNWEFTTKSIGASPARNVLYSRAKGKYLIGLDDDAHPINADFISQTISIFQKHPNVGIIAFKEIKGIFNSDEEALGSFDFKEEEYYCSDFIGCGFAIKKEVYDATNGFPVWIDIYGEESCVAIEVLSKGFDIIYSNKIMVNHRVDKEARKLAGKNYFRFGKQLKNTTYYYLVYYPFPLIKILKLYRHNFIKYALTDVNCFKIFFKIIVEVCLNIPKVLKYRKPIKNSLLEKTKHLSAIEY